LLSQRAKLEVRFAGITLIPRPIIAEPLAIAIALDAARHRAVQAVSSASSSWAGVRGDDDALVRSGPTRAGIGNSERDSVNRAHSVRSTDWAP